MTEALTRVQPPKRVRALLWLSGAAAAVLLPVAVVARGAFNVAADVPHWPATLSILELVRERSVSARAASISVPRFDDAAVQAGAGNYDAMCVQCHLRPELTSTELSRGLYPQPPALTRPTELSDAEAFWVIKHGIKMSGMPAWGKSMSDEDVWKLVAFLRELPALSPAEYEELVMKSPGHAHAGQGTTAAAEDRHHDDPRTHAEHDEQGTKLTAPTRGAAHEDE